MNKNGLEKKTINKVFWRSFMYGASWNYERGIGTGYSPCLESVSQS